MALWPYTILYFQKIASSGLHTESQVVRQVRSLGDEGMLHLFRVVREITIVSLPRMLLSRKFVAFRSRVQRFNRVRILHPACERSTFVSGRMTPPIASLLRHAETSCNEQTTFRAGRSLFLANCLAVAAPLHVSTDISVIIIKCQLHPSRTMRGKYTKSQAKTKNSKFPTSTWQLRHRLFALRADIGSQIEPHLLQHLGL